MNLTFDERESIKGFIERFDGGEIQEASKSLYFFMDEHFLDFDDVNFPEFFDVDILVDMIDIGYSLIGGGKKDE
jgi:hypothetical protein